DTLSPSKKEIASFFGKEPGLSSEKETSRTIPSDGITFLPGLISNVPPLNGEVVFFVNIRSPYALFTCRPRGRVTTLFGLFEKRDFSTRSTCSLSGLNPASRRESILDTTLNLASGWSDLKPSTLE